MSVDLRVDQVKPWLKLLVESMVQLNNNQGSLRKDIWDYLYQRYDNSVDYRDFLLAIRKFRLDGKLINKDGYYRMDDQVLKEIKEKTPTPVFSKEFNKQKNGNHFLQFISDKSRKDDVSGAAGSKISNSGKKQKVRDESAQGANIATQIHASTQQTLSSEQKGGNFQRILESESLKSSRLGFQSPATKRMKNQEAKKKVERDIKQLQMKKKFNQISKIRNNKISQMSKRIQKQKSSKKYQAPAQKTSILNYYKKASPQKKESTALQTPPKKEVKEVFTSAQKDKTSSKKELQANTKRSHENIKDILAKKKESTKQLPVLSKSAEKKKKSPSKKRDFASPIKKSKTISRRVNTSEKKKHLKEKLSKIRVTKTQRSKQQILLTLLKQLSGHKQEKLSKNRKAKVEATRNLKYLYSNSKLRQLNAMQLVKDDMIIYI